nr:MAG TPA: Type II secretion system, protein M [Caudoviricetes sp.]
MKKHLLGILNIAVLVIVLVVCCINLNARVAKLESRTDEMKKVVEEHERTIDTLKEKNRMQDTILNKLNSEYQMREQQRAEELQEVADRNGVGG